MARFPEVLGTGALLIAQSLRSLRNQVAHGAQTPTPGEAVAYVEHSAWLAARVYLTNERLRQEREAAIDQRFNEVAGVPPRQDS
jgi:hypothetical protein